MSITMLKIKGLKIGCVVFRKHCLKHYAKQSGILKTMEKELLENIFKIYDEAKNRILLYVEASVPEGQFKALRKLILDELGLSGAEGKIKQFLEKDRAGKS